MADGNDRSDSLYRARPTLRFGGLPDASADQLLERLLMSEAEGGLRSLELTLADVATRADGRGGPAFDDSPLLRLGAPIELYCGAVDAPREIFRGQITGLEGVHAASAAPQLCVYAEDALLAARFARRSAVYTEATPAEIVQAVAGRLGLEAVVTALAGPRATWVQLDETDLAFLRRLCARLDADLQVSERALNVSPRSEVQRPTLRLELGVELHRARVFADLADQLTSVSVRGWDAAAGRAVHGAANGLTHAGPGSGRDGASLLREAFGERPDNLGQFAPRSDAEAQALAEAAFDHRARRLVRVRGVAEGNPSLRVGSTVQLLGLGSRWNNDYYVVATRHRYDLGEGYRTEFTAECAYLGGAA